MRIKNVSQYPTEEVESLVKFGVGEHFKKLRVEVRNISKGYSGTCWRGKVILGLTRLRKRTSRLAMVRIGSFRYFPIKTVRFKSIPEEIISNWQEAIVLVSAHEAYHHFQFENGLPTSEKYAEMYAIKRVRAWRLKLKFIAAAKSIVVAATKCGSEVRK